MNPRYVSRHRVGSRQASRQHLHESAGDRIRASKPEKDCGNYATILLSNLSNIAVFSPRCAPVQPNFPRNSR